MNESIYPAVVSA